MRIPQVLVLAEKQRRLGRGLLMGTVLTLTGFAFQPVACGQAPRSPGSLGPASIRGTVVFPDGSPVTEAAKITLKVLRGDQATVYSDQLGRFELLNLAAGDYTLEVEADRSRFQVTSEKVQLQRNAPTFVTIYLKEKQAERRTVSGRTISVAMLDQKVPAGAKREFEKAARLASQGEVDESIEALGRALAIYPDYLMARNDLGAQLMDQGRLDEARTQLLAAIRIDPNAFNAQLNLGIVLVRQDNFAAGLQTLDKAMTLEPSAPAAHLYAGVACIGLKDLQRAEKELNAAYNMGGATYSVALVYLGRLYLTRGDRELALKTFQTYLNESPDGPTAVQVQKLVATLRQ